MQTTSNHGLKKPEYTDSADIADLNYNFDKIDSMPVLYRQSSEPSNKISSKTLWYDTTNGLLKLWNGTAWEEVGGGACDFMLSDTEFEANLEDEGWCERLFSSRFALATINGDIFSSYWWPKIVDSQQAMEVMSNSIIALSTALANSKAPIEIWKNTNSQEIWLAGDPPPPHTYYSGTYGTVDSIITTGKTSGGKCLLIRQESKSYSGTYSWSVDLDLTDIATLKIYTKRSAYASSYFYTEIRIGGTTVYSTNDSGHAWTLRSFDVSSLSGTVTLVLQMRITSTSSSTSRNGYSYFSDISLER